MENPNIREELQEWVEALENTLLSEGKEYTAELLQKVITEAKYLI